MLNMILPKWSFRCLSTVFGKHPALKSLHQICQRGQHVPRKNSSGCSLLHGRNLPSCQASLLIKRGYCSRKESDIHVTKENKIQHSSSQSSPTSVDVDKELLRYNVEEFYPASSDDEGSDTEIEDFSEVDTDSSKIIDVDKELERYNVDEFYGIEIEEQHITPVPKEEQLTELPFELKRGERGVFDVGDICQLLKAENVMDVCAISVPPELCYVDHLVIGTGSSSRHLKAVAKLVKYIWKRKRNPNDRVSVKIEGVRDGKAEDWFAMDLGNIALHLMLEDTRERYDIETLWTCGPDFDSQSRLQTTDQFLLPSPSELSAGDDPDELFVELARTFSQRHADPKSFRFGLETSDASTSGFRARTADSNKMQSSAMDSTTSERKWSSRSNDFNEKDDTYSKPRLTEAEIRRKYDGRTEKNLDSSEGWHQIKEDS